MRRATGNRSPWIEQLRPDQPVRPLDADAATDVAVIGAGIAGVATAFFLLHETNAHVLLIERDRAGRGATGHNAGQLATYFERPLCDLVEAYGFEPAIAAQRAIDEAWDLLDTMVATSGASVPIGRFAGHLGMFTLDHVTVLLRNSGLRRRGGLTVSPCLVADDAPFLGEIPADLAGPYAVTPRAEIRRRIGPTDDRYCAVISDRKGCINGALLVEQVLDHLGAAFAARFRCVDATPVRRVVLDRASASIDAGGHTVTARQVVMCTNGSVDHLVVDTANGVRTPLPHRVLGDIGYMVGFVEEVGPIERETKAISYIRNDAVGGSTPYVYTTRRRFDTGSGDVTLTCMGGPEHDRQTSYSADDEVPGEVLEEMDRAVAPIVCPDRAAGAGYEYAWHGLMGYTDSRVRLIGFEPRNPVLLYNLGCNGVGFLPSIYGGSRIARLVRGDELGPSIFDPPDLGTSIDESVLVTRAPVTATC